MKYGLHSFTYLKAKLWNSLPDNLTTSESLNEFKKNNNILVLPIFNIKYYCKFI